MKTKQKTKQKEKSINDLLNEFRSLHKKGLTKFKHN